MAEPLAALMEKTLLLPRSSFGARSVSNTREIRQFQTRGPWVVQMRTAGTQRFMARRYFGKGRQTQR